MIEDDVQSGSAGTPRIYYLHPTLGGGPETWDGHLLRAQRLGFSHILLAWPFSASDDLFLTHDIDSIAGQPASGVLDRLNSHCRAHGLQLWIDVAIDRADGTGPFVAQHEDWWHEAAAANLDPRTIHRQHEQTVRFVDEAVRRELTLFWQDRLLRWQRAGISGIRCHNAAELDLEFWQDILQPAQDAQGSFAAFGWMPGRPRPDLVEATKAFQYLPSSVAWWTGGEHWLMQEYNDLAGSAPLIGFPEDPFGGRITEPAAINLDRRHSLAVSAAALLADGWLMPMGFEFEMEAPFIEARREDFEEASSHRTDELQEQIRALNRAVATNSAAAIRSMRGLELRSDFAAIVRVEDERPARLVLLNRDPINACEPDMDRLAAKVEARPQGTNVDRRLPSATGSQIALSKTRPVQNETVMPPQEWMGLHADRLAIEAVTPAVDNGRFAAKRTVGDVVAVEADIFSDGHDVLAAELRWRAVDESEWSRAPMRLLVNDRWRGEFPLLRTGRHVFAIMAWWSEFGTFRRDLGKKHAAGVPIALELREGRLILEKFAATAPAADRPVIERHLQQLVGADSDQVANLLSDELGLAMERADPRPHTIRSEIYPVDADREAASFSSWYELFPRSITDDPAHHGTFRNVIGRLPAIKAMGFDVLYFPPIHPIGTTNRKGRNNTLTPAPDDPGSPYAIGSPEGGHDAIHPELGTPEDFRALVEAAAKHGLELALDFAIQCSPDHPWLREHPDWFQWRPDGSMRYAENPPKKYQDIVNVDFYGPGAIPGLWLALRDVVQHWVDQGVRIFRVDNPHTKPFPFWEWLISDIRSRDPGVIFLSEAFTRPKVMYRLGKVGFTQSYTYFTWRNSKAELTEYLTQLNEAPVRDLFRPHFFVNTPDINPAFLQSSGRPGFLIRAALAATLSGLWGVYSGFELCEAAAIPGKEEYLDSEKYEIKPRDWQAPGNIIAEITRLNQLRRSHPALQSHLGLTFYNAADDNILYFGKRVGSASEIILVAINLDPFGVHGASIEVPLWEFGLPDHGTVAVENLMRGARFDWHGKWQTIRLDPQDTPFAIWRITPGSRFQ
ncbi:alpha-1,4-glucan--maltose-1-phosphate maltosyltransferase [Bosea sp. CCNWLW174]|uniref:alpha-1,4-glucan--maltose-1-phosphate maltosyltransferase n=1 Tax=unclassified Bosea (in: a-proteobacteria) TaxID=2653178 RepID=UPI003014B070